MLSLAWKNLAAYPPGHPSLAGAVDSAHRALAELRGPAGEVTLGVAADGIVYGTEKIDTVPAQKFGQALYARGIAVVRFAAETSVPDLETFLRLITGLPGDKGAPLWEELTASGVVNINLQPVDYSGVQVTKSLAPEPLRRETLWDDILRALVAGRELSPRSQELLRSDIRSVDELSALILRYMDTVDDQAQFDPEATFGVRLNRRRGKTADLLTERVAEAIGAHVDSSTGMRKHIAVQQVIQLLRTMPEPLRSAIVRAVIRPLASDEKSGMLLRDLSLSLHHDEVIEALRYLSSMGKLSSHAMALLQALVSTHDTDPGLPPAPPAVVTELIHLFGDEDIDRFNPPEHQDLMAQVKILIPRVTEDAGGLAKLGNRVETVVPEAVERQLATTIVELLSRHGERRDVNALLARMESLFHSALAAGEFGDAVEIIEPLRQMATASDSEPLRKAIDESLGRVASTETVRTLVDNLANASPERAAAIHRLLNGLGAAATRNLLLALSEEDNRSRRRRLFDLVVSLGPSIVPEVIHFLSDDRWYVVRNMIVLLRSVNDRTSLPEIRRIAQHSDLRVRLEAIKTLLAFDASVPRTLLAEAINDRDPKMAEAAISLVGSYGIKEAVGPLVRILAKRDLFGMRRPLRIRAIKALGELAEPDALPQMQHLFSTSFLPWPNRAERQAAFESLAAYPPEARAPFVERGLRSRDREIRQICRRLSA